LALKQALLFPSLMLLPNTAIPVQVDRSSFPTQLPSAARNRAALFWAKSPIQKFSIRLPNCLSGFPRNGAP
ncbi:MAG: hypothetical protein LOD87_10680, partial [Planifilum fulgidum]